MNGNEDRISGGQDQVGDSERAEYDTSSVSSTNDSITSPALVSTSMSRSFFGAWRVLTDSLFILSPVAFPASFSKDFFRIRRHRTFPTFLLLCTNILLCRVPSEIAKIS